MKHFSICFTYVCLQLYVVFRPLSHMETSLPVAKSCKFWPMLSAHGHWDIMDLNVLHPLWHGGSIFEVISGDPVVQRLAVKLSLPVCLNDLLCHNRHSNTQPSARKANARINWAVRMIHLVCTVYRDLKKMTFSIHIRHAPLHMKIHKTTLNFSHFII